MFLRSININRIFIVFLSR